MAPLEVDFPGYWGEPTSTIDWCEANYAVSYYIAEFWNTISNIIMIVPPIIGGFLAYKDGLEARIIWCHISLLVVGIGSWCFHGTLLYNMQLLDELPMIWGMGCLVYTVYETESVPGTKNGFLQKLLFSYCLIVTIVYITIKEPVFHEAAYAILVVTDIFLSVRILNKFKFPYSAFLCYSGLATYGVGFIIWNLDWNFCSQFQELRSQVAPPLRPFLQGHAWWHLLAGVGTYLSLLFLIHIRLCYLKRTYQFQRYGCLPVIRS